MQKDQTHIIDENEFTHIYCEQGCAYYVTGKQTQQFAF